MNDVLAAMQAVLGKETQSILPGLTLKKDVKDGRAWRFEVPYIGDDLEFQIYFKRRFSDLVGEKKISKLVTKLADVLADDKFLGEFLIDVVPEARSVIITQPGFWKNFKSSPEEFVHAVESVCEVML